MRIKPFRAVYPNLNFITSPDEFFGTVKERYPEYRESGFFNRTAQESVYIYQIKSPHRVYKGMVACTDIRDYLEGKIKKHENTLAAKEQKQMHLMLQRGAIVKPVLLTYPEIPQIAQFIDNIIAVEDPFYAVLFESENQSHTFWEISEGKQIEIIQDFFKNLVPETYIADGHHRSSTTALMHKRIGSQAGEPDYDQMLCAFFPANELDVHDYNRVVDGLTDMSLTTYMAKIAQLFEIEILEEPRKPLQKHEIIMYVNREWFALTWKERVLKEYEEEKVLLDVSLLDEKVLHHILGIKDVRTDLRIKYVEGPKGVEDIRNKTNKSETRIGFLLYPVHLNDLIAKADANQVMPPKSTWFEPRIKNGLIVQEW